MDDERVVEEIITKFLLNTCRLRPQLSRPALKTALHCAHVTRLHHGYDAAADAIQLITGSVAEFYIEPMLPHIGDVDVMYHFSTELAIPRGHPTPTQLPDVFHKYVQVYEIIDSHLPGYVYLALRYLLTECVDDGKYNAFEYGTEIYLQNTSCYEVDASDIHGPAISVQSGSSLSADSVRCLRCLVWPPQAADWPTRQRNHSWPDSATVDRVVSSGCDVVAWHIVSVDKMRGWASFNTDCHFHEQKLYC